MKRKKISVEKSANKMCFAFKSKYKSMQTIINSLQNINKKSELFLQQFDIDLNEQNLNEYKDLFTKFKYGFTSAEDILADNWGQNQSKTSAKRLAKTEDKSLSDEENDSDFCANASDHSLADNNDSEDVDESTGHRSSGGQTMDDLESKIVVFYDKSRKTKKREKRFRCGVRGCDVSSHSRANIMAHLVKHTNERDYQCSWPKCEKSFGYQKSLISHMESFHLRKERHKCCCSGCGLTFLGKLQLNQHMSEKHSNEVNHCCVWTECQLNKDTFRCLWPQCQQMFKNKKLLDTHIEDSHLKSRIDFSTNQELIQKSEQKEFKCNRNDCNFDTNNEQLMAEHKAKHKARYQSLNRRNRPKEEVKLQYSDSDNKFTNKYTGKPLSRRRRDKSHPCSWPACELTFESPNAVRIHMRKHTGEKPFACDWPECHKTFRYRPALKLHKEMIHLRLKQFKCDWPECEEGFISLSQLQVHRTEHTGVKKFRCDWPGCDWRTNHSQQLSIHRMRTHEGLKVRIKKYKNKNASNPNSIYDFRGELKRYACDWPGCERRFRYSSNLEQHIRMHQKSDTDPPVEKKRKPKAKKYKEDGRRYGQNYKQKKEKLFECQWPDCQCKYTTKTMLTQHQNTHTGVKPYQCQHCDQSFPYGNSLRKHHLLYHENGMPDKPYKCQYYGCTRSFDKNKSLAFHVKRVHEKSNESNNTIDKNEIQTPVSQPNPSVIRLDRIKAFNTMRIQTQFPTQMPINYEQMPIERHQHVRRMSATPYASHSSVTTAKKLLTNAMKKRPNVQNYTTIDNDSIAIEKPHPCPLCPLRRFRTEKALDCHTRKHHPKQS